MRRPDKPDQPADEPLLFDLPLAGPKELAADPPLERERPAPSPRGAKKPAPPAPELPLAARPMPVPHDEPAHEPEAAPGDGHASRGRRFAAGLADLVVHAAIGVAALLGAGWLGVRPALADWPALAVLLLSFSFLYIVLPLAFWGHTPGMAWAGLSARNRDGEPLTLDQTVRRWLGAVLTFLTLGLPLLVLIGGRSLTDWISGSGTYGEEPA
jgi:uncharacterized RDD family membrane protein YckC